MCILKLRKQLHDYLLKHDSIDKPEKANIWWHTSKSESIKKTTAFKMLPYKFYYNIMTKYCQTIMQLLYLFPTQSQSSSMARNYTINQYFYLWRSFAMKIIAVNVKSFFILYPSSEMVKSGQLPESGNILKHSYVCVYICQDEHPDITTF